MAEATWSDEDLSPQEREELTEAVRIANEEEARGEMVEYGGDTGRSISEEVKNWGREMIAAEKKRAS